MSGETRSFELALALVVVFLPISGAAPTHTRPLGAKSPLRSAAPLALVSGHQASKLPIFFEATRGHAGQNSEFLARLPGYSALFSPSEVAFLARRSPNSARRAPLRLILAGDLSGPWRARGELPGRVNYLMGRDPKRWKISISLFKEIESSANSGAQWKFRGVGSSLEYELLLPRAADAARYRFLFEGADAIEIGRSGDLLVRQAGFTLRMARPALYQPEGSERRAVSGGYKLLAGNEVGFRLGAHDEGAPLVIDPTLTVSYATFLGGAGDDSANGVALDSFGRVYISGTTTSASFPESSAALGPGGGNTDFFIAKFDPTQSGAASLIYLTFLGGSSAETGGFLAVDSSGDAGIAGVTTSPDFPVTDSSQRTSGSNDLAVSVLNPAGNGFVFSTLLGGNGAEMTQNFAGIAVDTANNFYVASDTSSSNLATTLGAFHGAYGGGTSDAFLAKFTPAGQLSYLTYLGINATVGASGVAVDTAQNAYLAGFTSPPLNNSFPTKNAFQASYGGGAFDGFVMKLNPALAGANALVYASFLGGNGTDQALAVGVDSLGTAYVTGSTSSTNFPTNGPNAAFQTSLASGAAANAFLTAVSQNSSTGATSLAYSTYFGGNASDSGLGLAVESPSQVFVAGGTTSVNFPAHDNLQPFGGNSDAFLAEFNPTASGNASRVFATFLSGTENDAQANAVAVDSSGNAFVAGKTTASDFPLSGATPNGAQAVCSSCQASPPLNDAFLVNVSQSATLPAGVIFSATNLKFGTQPLGTAANPIPAEITNSGDAGLNITSMAMTGPNSSDFSLQNSSGCTSAAIPPGGNCSFEVGFTPSAGGPEKAFVTVTDNAPGNPQLLLATGTGDAPHASVSPSSLNFGNQPTSSTSNAQTIVVTNTGTQALTISAVNISGANSGDFTTASGTTCVSNTTLQPQTNCQINVVFSPSTTGPLSAEVDISDNSDNQSSAKQVVPLSGTGTTPAPVVSLSPTSLSFGTQAVGTASGTQLVTLTNTGSATLNVSSIALAGANSGDFQFSSTATTCNLGSSSLGAGQSCIVAAFFQPTSSGAKTAAIEFTDDAAGSPQSVALSGTGVIPVALLSPSSLTFQGQTVGTTSPPQTVMLTNPGDAALSINNIGIAGSNPNNFAETNNCPPALNPSVSCSINVTFSPTEGGSRSATLTLSDNASGSPQSVSLSGTGLTPSVQLSPSPVSFASQLSGTKSTPVPVTLTNGGSGTLLFSVTLGGTNPGDFAESDMCNGTVAAQGTCTLNVVFQPSTLGTRTATLNLSDNAPDSPQTVALSGTGSDFSLGAASGGSTSATVAAGQTATYNLQLNPAGGFSGAVSLSCSGAPLASTCTVSPNTLSVPASSAAVPFNVSVATTARTAAWRPPRETRDNLRWQFVTLLGAVYLLAFLAGRRRRFAYAFTSAALLICLGVALASCGGGGSGGGGGTPAGTYQLSVTGTQQGGQRSVTLTLTVQ